MRTLTQPALAVQVSELKAVLPALSRIIRSKITLPILGMVKVEASPSGQALHLTATDLDLSIRVEVPCLFTIEEREALLVPMAELQRVVKTASNRQQGIDLRSLRCEEEVRDFPEDAKLTEVTTVALGEDDVDNLFNAFCCVSEEQTRYVLCGVNLDPADGGRLIGTDGRHLALFEAPGVAALKDPFILPDHRLWSWRGFQEGRGCTLHLGTFGESSGGGSPGFRLEGEGWTVTGKGIEGNYPNYRQVIPSASQFVTQVELGPEGNAALAEKLEQLGRWKDTPTGVGLRIENHELHLLHREKSDQPLVATRIPTSRVKGADMTVMFKREYLIKAPRFGFMRMDLIDPCSPVKFTGEQGFLIVMPLRLEGPPSVRAAESENGAAPAPSPVPAASPQSDEPQAQFEQQQPEQQRQPEQQQQPKTNNMKPTNGTHPVSSTSSNGNHGHSGNGHRPAARHAVDREEEEPTSSAGTSATSITTSDPMEAAVQQLAQARDTLRLALAGLGELMVTLKSARQQQRDTEREMRAVRSTIRSLKEINL